MQSDIVQQWTRAIADRKVRDSNPSFSYQLLLSRLGQRGSISVLVLPSGMKARHRKNVTTERVLLSKTYSILIRKRFIQLVSNRSPNDPSVVDNSSTTKFNIHHL
ncbi:hypothetical protein CSKR_109636 [Clonorchis sinensis]|uniref:Uncharacterized protein n=1 Tax=Clonorchis sinensis TaxID=79923 RepID=A0A419PSJ9_CLOSI|nr:hypothetical protein CSKR_109636 [Clonorchis sinensis]